MEAQPLQDESQPQDGAQVPDPVSAEVADTIAHVHVEGKGLDTDLERSFEND